MILVLQVLLGIIFLGIGGEWLVKGASRLAYGLGLPPLVIGLTVVAMGTSAPEFVIAFQSALRGHMDVSFGDVIGSNFFNAFFILGVCAIAAPFHVSASVIRKDLMGMVLCTAFFWILCLDLNIHPLEGIFLAGTAVFYTIFRFSHASQHRETVEEARENFSTSRQQYKKLSQLFLSGLLIVSGILFLSGGSHVLLQAVVKLARQWGVSEYFIGLAMVAVGTSLPELISALTAVFRKKEELAVGNIIGSNIYNLSLILGGVTGMQPESTQVPLRIIRTDLPLMVGAFGLWCLLAPQFQKMGRKTGLIFLAVYAFYFKLQL